MKLLLSCFASTFADFILYSSWGTDILHFPSWFMAACTLYWPGSYERPQRSVFLTVSFSSVLALSYIWGLSLVCQLGGQLLNQGGWEFALTQQSLKKSCPEQLVSLVAQKLVHTCPCSLVRCLFTFLCKTHCQYPQISFVAGAMQHRDWADNHCIFPCVLSKYRSSFTSDIWGSGGWRAWHCVHWGDTVLVCSDNSELSKGARETWVNLRLLVVPAVRNNHKCVCCWSVKQSFQKKARWVF